MSSLEFSSNTCQPQRCGLTSISLIAPAVMGVRYLCQKMSGNHPREFQKRSQLFIRAHNETLSVVAMCVHNPSVLAK